MKEIKLTNGYISLVDDEDFEKLNTFKWTALKNGHTYYAIKNKSKVCHYIRMHRLIMNVPKNSYVDHINLNGLDNRKENLRICTNEENQCNKEKPKNNTSGYKGVSWNKTRNKWQAMIGKNNKMYHLGFFNNKEDAYEAYCKSALELHGEFANIG